MTQLSEQPSPLTKFPSSHCSLPSLPPLPQEATLPSSSSAESYEALFAAFPSVWQPGSAVSERTSPSLSTVSLHWNVMTQLSEQPSPLIRFPSSHCSEPSLPPLPQDATLPSLLSVESNDPVFAAFPSVWQPGSNGSMKPSLSLSALSEHCVTMVKVTVSVASTLLKELPSLRVSVMAIVWEPLLSGGRANAQVGGPMVEGVMDCAGPPSSL